ncbi:MAG: FAD binding domain-containing protein [Pseudomonadota bacterium]|nr:FAD binding domain-containing protein [Pseudomonadota bacterium]
MKPLDYIIPSSAEEAVALLAENTARARALAGGTDLVVDLKHAPGDVDLLVDISQLPEFSGIEETEEGLRIGSMVTFSELMASPIVNQMTPEIVAASHTVGAVQTRNLGTIGGNLVTCVPSADSAPSLLALDAIATIAGSDGKRSVPLEEFFVGPRKTILEPHELLAEILIPKKNLGKPSHFIKFGLRKGQALALVNVAAALYLNDDGKVAEPRIALGAVAPTPMFARKAEVSLDGKKPDEENLLEAARVAVSEIKPIDDFRASANYRRHLVQTLTYRTLKRSAEIASEQ